MSNNNKMSFDEWMGYFKDIFEYLKFPVTFNYYLEHLDEIEKNTKIVQSDPMYFRGGNRIFNQKELNEVKQELIEHKNNNKHVDYYSPMRKKCKRSQKLNRKTSRCRKTPCAKGETRDVSSRRCRKKKCSPRKTRDVTSHRCRKKKSPGRKSPKRKSPGCKSPKRKSPGRKSPKRKSPKRKSPTKKSRK